MKCEDCGKALVFKSRDELRARLIVGWMHYSSVKLSAQLGTRIPRNTIHALATCKCGNWYVEYHKLRAKTNTVAKIKGHDGLHKVGKKYGVQDGSTI